MQIKLITGRDVGQSSLLGGRLHRVSLGEVDGRLELVGLELRLDVGIDDDRFAGGLHALDLGLGRSLVVGELVEEVRGTLLLAADEVALDQGGVHALVGTVKQAQLPKEKM